MLCFATAGTITALATTSFTLGWTHSVEHTHWEESWRLSNGRLELVSASVEGSGAGIALPDDAVRVGDKWVFKPTLPPLTELRLAASGATQGGWTLCTPDECFIIGETPEREIRLWADPNEQKHQCR